LPRRDYASVTVPVNLVNQARRVVKGGTRNKYRSAAEIVAEALEEKLESLKGIPVVSVREVSREYAERLIIRYLQKNPGFHYPSDLANTLGLDIEPVFEITQSLLREQIIETTARKEAEAR